MVWRDVLHLSLGLGEERRSRGSYLGGGEPGRTGLGGTLPAYSSEVPAPTQGPAAPVTGRYFLSLTFFRLWHQLTLQVLDFVQDPCFAQGDGLIKVTALSCWVRLPKCAPGLGDWGFAMTRRCAESAVTVCQGLFTCVLTLRSNTGRQVCCGRFCRRSRAQRLGGLP